MVASSSGSIERSMREQVIQYDVEGGKVATKLSQNAAVNAKFATLL